MENIVSLLTIMNFSSIVLDYFPVIIHHGSKSLLSLPRASCNKMVSALE